MYRSHQTGEYCSVFIYRGSECTDSIRLVSTAQSLYTGDQSVQIASDWWVLLCLYCYRGPECTDGIRLVSTALSIYTGDQSVQIASDW